MHTLDTRDRVPLPLAAPTLAGLLAPHAARTPQAVALEAPGRVPLPYAALASHVAAVASALGALSVRRGDVVATLIPDGPDALTAVLGVASAGAAAAPINPGAHRDEIAFVLDDVGARVLLLAGALDPAVRAAARAAATQRTRVVLLEPLADAGRFTLDGERPELASYAGDEAGDAAGGHADDVALLMHTSGTTARPKLVPLTHANLCAASTASVAALGLGPDDRSLVVNPLFHVSGLIAAALCALAAGGSAVCTPGFSAAAFLDWLDAYRPTWYTATPAVHQAVLAAAAERPGAGRRHALRFIRSGAAPLPPHVAAGLERLFGVPVLEGYALTEAPPQVACNPLPPRPRKAGSVGVAAGAEVVVLDDAGRVLPAGARGEIALRGPGVVRRYARDDDSASFTADGWFRTGDLGHLDADGYLFVAGRRKEMINRGGEKVSPHEVDAVLLTHPDVARAATFPVPHATLGEDVATAVVARAGTTPAARALRDFAAAHLSPAKAPRRVLVVDAIPLGASGKPRRHELAAHFAGRLAEPEADAAAPVPTSAVAEVAAALWADVLGAPPAGAGESFFAAGGDSLRMTQLAARLADVLGVELPLGQFFQDPSFGAVAAAVEALVAGLPVPAA